MRYIWVSWTTSNAKNFVKLQKIPKIEKYEIRL